LKELSDEKLMALVQLGKINYLELLFVRYQKQLFNYFLRCTMDRSASEDLTQNAFVRVLKYRGSYRAELGFRIWLFQVARNLVRDHFRERNRHDGVSMPVDQIADPAGAEPDQEQVEREQRLQQALGRLPPEKRELLVLGKLQGMKYEDIARLYGTNINAVKVRVHRALAELRNVYFNELKE
jgi:RNA polymerase sigma-70 factor (ECF subfamily)